MAIDEKARELTSKQKNFCRNIIEGKSLSAAYRQSYNTKNMKPETIRREAHRLSRNPNVATTVERLESEADVVMVEKTIADRKEVLETLTRIMRGQLEADSNRVRATQLLAQSHDIFKEQQEKPEPLKSSSEILAALRQKLSSISLN